MNALDLRLPGKRVFFNNDNRVSFFVDNKVKTFRLSNGSLLLRAEIPKDKPETLHRPV